MSATVLKAAWASFLIRVTAALTASAAEPSIWGAPTAAAKTSTSSLGLSFNDPLARLRRGKR